MCLFSVRTNVRISARKVGEDSEDARSQWGRNHWCPGPDLLFYTILFPLCFLCHSSLPWVNGVNSLNAPSCLREENEWVAGFINANIGLLEQLSLQQEKYISRYSAICTLYLCVYDAMMHTVSHFFFSASGRQPQKEYHKWIPMFAHALSWSCKPDLHGLPLTELLFYCLVPWDFPTSFPKGCVISFVEFYK